jgi:hypothetical protein
MRPSNGVMPPTVHVTGGVPHSIPQAGPRLAKVWRFGIWQRQGAGRSWGAALARRRQAAPDHADRLVNINRPLWTREQQITEAALAFLGRVGM